MTGTSAEWVVRFTHFHEAIHIAPSCYPPVSVFDDVASPEDLVAVLAVEAITDPRQRQDAGEISVVPEEYRLSGPGTEPIMTAFMSPDLAGARFNEGRHGAYYAASNHPTAIAETVHQRERILGYSDIGAQVLSMTSFVGEVAAPMIDIRSHALKKSEGSLLSQSHDYLVSQAFGEARRTEGAWGITYRSIRHARGQCVAVFRPSACKPVRIAKHYHYYYDGHRVQHVAEVKVVPF